MVYNPTVGSGAGWARFETSSGLGQSFTVDWGDGKTDYYSETQTCADHMYVGVNNNPSKKQSYEIKISGTFKKISFMSSFTSESNYVSCVKEIKQWGTTGLEDVSFNGCYNLSKIAEPTESSFKNLNYINFNGCRNLEAIPENLFLNCSKLTNFSQLFENCVSLTSIPRDLFDDCDNVTSFYRTFSGCENLTGEALPLWERVENGQTNDYIGTPNGENCYQGCTSLTNYNDIPTYWKENPEEIIY